MTGRLAREKRAVRPARANARTISRARGPTPWSRTRSSRDSDERATVYARAGCRVCLGDTRGNHVINSSVVREQGSPRVRVPARALDGRAWFRTQESNLDRAVQSRVSCRLDESGRRQMGSQGGSCGGGRVVRTRHRAKRRRMSAPSRGPSRAVVGRPGVEPGWSHEATTDLQSVPDPYRATAPRRSHERSSRCGATGRKREGHRSPGGPRCRRAWGRSTADGPRWGRDADRTRATRTAGRTQDAIRWRSGLRAESGDCCGRRDAWEGIPWGACVGYVRAGASIYSTRTTGSPSGPAPPGNPINRAHEECNRW